MDQKLSRVPALAGEPQARKRPTSHTWHGVTLTDEFAWLKAANWPEVMRDPAALDSEIRAYLDAENAYCDSVLTDTEATQAQLMAEMKGRIKEDDDSVPVADGPFAYFEHYREGGQHPVVCRLPRAGGPTQVMLDGDALAQGRVFFDLGPSRHSPDHTLLAWSADEAGSEYYTLRVRDIASGADLADIVVDTAGPPVWTADSTAFYYVRLDAQHRPSRVYRHRLGTPASDDALVFETTDPQFFVSLSDTQSGSFAVVSVHDHETSAAWLIDLSLTDAAPQPIAPDRKSTRLNSSHPPESRMPSSA